MEVFGAYSKYYDLLYKDKDYKSEADFVHGLIQKYAPDAKTILDLGCGTGKHDLLFAQKGYQVTGIDISAEMISIAKTSLSSLKSEHFIPPKFLLMDIRTVQLNEKFDSVISLFHVMSYQVTNDDVIATLETASRHLNQEGIFIFDCWYGPGVLTDPPTVRLNEIENKDMAVTRLAKPTVHFHRNIVDVNYHVFVRDKISQNVDELKECHKMRYFFKPEIELFLKRADFELLDFVEFMKNTPPGKGKWNACFVCRKIESPSESSNIK